MKLLPLEKLDLLELVANWLAHKENYQWLDFGLRTIERLGFRFIGRQRQCHIIDGRLYDRLMFDLLASEHRELDEARWHRIMRAHRKAACEEREAQPG